MVYIKTNKQTNHPLNYEAFQKQGAKSTIIALYCTAETDSRAGHKRSAAAYLAPLRKVCLPFSCKHYGVTPTPRAKGLPGCSPLCCTLAGRNSREHLHQWRREKYNTNHGKPLCVTVCNSLWTMALRSKELQDGSVLMTKKKKLNLCSFLHLVKEIMHFPQSLMPAPQGLYYYLLFYLLK